jgi:hypothetical protein
MIQNYNNLWKWNEKFGKICTLWKLHINSFTITNTKNWYIEATMSIFNNKLQTINH